MDTVVPAQRRELSSRLRRATGEEAPRPGSMKRRGPWRCAVLLAVVTCVVVVLAAHLRWSLASTTTWQCDEIPLLVRLTGLCGNVTNEAEAAEFNPTYYSCYMGALRSLRAPNFVIAFHTTTAFWVNLTVHLFGVTPAAGRLMPLVWSLLAMATAGWATWIACRSVPAVCLAGWMIGLSPHATAYGAQARGYAEAMALAPLLLISLEYLRRRPDRWIRAVAVFLCALQLSLTLYTTWLYWVLPTLAAAILLLPWGFARAKARGSGGDPARAEARGSLGRADCDSSSGALRTVLIVIAVGLCAVMTVFTIDRFASLSVTATRMGLELGSPAEGVAFVRRLVHALFARPIWLAWLALIGVGVLWRSSVRWWLGVLALGLLVPAALALGGRSLGYERNLGHLVGIMAVLFGLGGDAVLRAFGKRFRPGAVGAVAAAALAGMTAWSYAGLGERARATLLPDWGAAVVALEQQPETVGPRWLCPCLANHWQINWYRRPRGYGALLAVPVNGRIEVVMGAQFGLDGAPKVYNADPAGYAKEVDVPEFIAATAPYTIDWGLELRRWRGTRIPGSATASLADDAPLLILAPLTGSATSANWRAFLKEVATSDSGALMFKRITGSTHQIASMITPAGGFEQLQESFQHRLTIGPTNLRCFALTPLQ